MFKHKFKWHLLTAFLTLIVIEIFDDGFQPIVPALIALLIGSVILGLFLCIGEWLVNHFIDGVFKGLKRIKNLLYNAQDMALCSRSGTIDCLLKGV